MDIVFYTEGLPFTGSTLDERSLGGSESAFIYLAREFAKMGHNVTAFCVCQEEGLFAGVRYYYLTRWEGWRQQQSCDVFICSRFFHVFREPIHAAVKILWCHDLFMDYTVRDMNLVFPRIDLVYGLSDYHVEQIVKLFPEQRHKVRKASNGVDLDYIDSIVAALPEKKYRIVFSSRPERGLAEALEAYQILNDPSLEFVICTYQYPGENTGSEYLERIAQLRDNGFNITFESFNKTALYQLLVESKLVIYPPYFLEIFCISAVEAQACGTAYLTRPLAALAETVATHPEMEYGPAAFAQEMKRILYDEDVRKQMEKKGRAHAARYTWDKVAGLFLADAAELLRPAADAKEPAGTQTLPLISCLMVTSNRLILLKEAINCYIDQTYPNKELIIIGSGLDAFKKGVEDYLADLGRDDIHFTWSDIPDNSLGKKRNLSIDRSTGPVLCLWDDDDLYHPQRIELQFRHMIENNAQACFLSDHLQFFEHQRELFWIDWTFQDLLRRNEQMLPGSMMIVRDDRFRYPEEGPTSIKAEDNAFMDSFYGKIKVATLSDHGFLYIYRFHQRNIHSKMHHERVTAFGSREREYILLRQPSLAQALSYYQLPKPYFLKERNGQLISVHNS